MFGNVASDVVEPSVTTSGVVGTSVAGVSGFGSSCVVGVSGFGSSFFGVSGVSGLPGVFGNSGFGSTLVVGPSGVGSTIVSPVASPRPPTNEICER